MDPSCHLPPRLQPPAGTDPPRVEVAKHDSIRALVSFQRREAECLGLPVRRQLKEGELVRQAAGAQSLHDPHRQVVRRSFQVGLALRPIAGVRVDSIEELLIPQALSFRGEDMRPNISLSGQQVLACQPADTAEHRQGNGPVLRKDLIFRAAPADDRQSTSPVTVVDKILKRMGRHWFPISTRQHQVFHVWEWSHGLIGRAHGKAGNVEWFFGKAVFRVDLAWKHDSQSMIFDDVSDQRLDLDPTGRGCQFEIAHQGVGPSLFGTFLPVHRELFREGQLDLHTKSRDEWPSLKQGDPCLLAETGDDPVTSRPGIVVGVPGVSPILKIAKSLILLSRLLFDQIERPILLNRQTQKGILQSTPLSVSLHPFKALFVGYACLDIEAFVAEGGDSGGQ